MKPMKKFDTDPSRRRGGADTLTTEISVMNIARSLTLGCLAVALPAVHARSMRVDLTRELDGTPTEE